MSEWNEWDRASEALSRLHAEYLGCVPVPLAVARAEDAEIAAMERLMARGEG